MSDVVALFRESGSSLVIDGALSVTETFPGEVTDDPLPDRSYASTGRTDRPSRISVRALVSPNPTVQGLKTGDARLQEVRDWLARAKRDVDVLDVQRPGRALATGFVIATYTLSQGNTDAEELQLDLVEVQIARSQSVTLETRRAAAVPTEAAKPGQAEEADKGTAAVKDKSYFASILDSFTGGE